MLEDRLKNLSPERRRAFERLLAERKKSAARTEKKRALLPRTGTIPLSYAQQRWWILEQLEGHTGVYNVPMAWRLRGALDVPALERSFAALVARHELLRT